MALPSVGPQGPPLDPLHLAGSLGQGGCGEWRAGRTSLLLTFHGQGLSNMATHSFQGAGTYKVPGRRGYRCDEHLAKVCHKRCDQGHIGTKGQS